MLQINLCIAIQLALLLSFYGWGRAFLRLFLPEATLTSAAEATIPAWLGWAATLFLLQVLHLVFPLHGAITIIMHGIGIGFAAYFIRRDLPQIAWRENAKGIFVILGVTYPFLAWLTARSFLPPVIYDNGLYHLSTIRWINEYPIVVGLVNLHGRLAFNQSYFVYLASLNVHPFFGHGRTLANSSLAILTILTAVSHIVAHFRERETDRAVAVLRLVPALFAFPILYYWLTKPPAFGSPSADFASGVIQIALFLLLLQGIGSWLAGRRSLPLYAAALAFLATTLLTVKLSGIVFAAGAFGYVLLYLLRSPERSVRLALRVLLPPVLLMTLWMSRGVIMSGAPVYPSAIGLLPVPWAVSERSAYIDRAAVTGFARDPSREWHENLGHWEWLPVWWDTFRLLNVPALIPLGLFALFLIISIGLLVTANGRHRYGLLWLMILPIVGNIIFWFFMAPDVRFSGSLFFLLPVISGLLLLVHLSERLDWRRLRVAIAGVVALGSIHYALHTRDNWGEMFTVSAEGWGPVRVETFMTTFTTDSGLVLHIPVASDQCWDAELPCTPYPNPKLRLRRPDDLSSGFVLEE